MKSGAVGKRMFAVAEAATCDALLTDMTRPHADSRIVPA